PNPNGNVNTLLADGATVYAGGGFTSIGGLTRNRIAQLDAVTGVATGWNPGANNNVLALARDGSTIYAGGAFTQIGGKTPFYLAAIDAAGVATNWNPFINAQVRTLAVSAGTLYLGGDFTNLNSGASQRAYIASIDAATQMTKPWNPTAQFNVQTLLLVGRTVYAGGSFLYVSFQPQSRLVAIEDPSALAVTPRFPTSVRLQLRAAPNPLRGDAALRFNLPRPARVTLRVF